MERFITPILAWCRGCETFVAWTEVQVRDMIIPATESANYVATKPVCSRCFFRAASIVLATATTPPP